MSLLTTEKSKLVVDAVTDLFPEFCEQKNMHQYVLSLSLSLSPPSFSKQNNPTTTWESIVRVTGNTPA